MDVARDSFSDLFHEEQVKLGSCIPAINAIFSRSVCSPLAPAAFYCLQVCNCNCISIHLLQKVAHHLLTKSPTSAFHPSKSIQTSTNPTLNYDFVLNLKLC